MPVPTQAGGELWIWLKEPLTKGNQPYVHASIEANKKFYDLPCPVENVIGVAIR